MRRRPKRLNGAMNQEVTMPLNLVEGQYAPGDPFTADLATDDLEAAKAFYGPLFDWEFAQVGDHHRAVRNDRMAAGLGMLRALDLGATGWTVCMAATNPSATVKRAEELGGRAAGPVKVDSLGTVAAVHDPDGALFGLWHPESLEPGALGAAHGGFAWAELTSDEPSRAVQFYASLFDVKAVPVESQGEGNVEHGEVNLERTELEVKRTVAGIVPTRADAGTRKPGWLPYFMVDSIQRSADRAKEAGGQVLGQGVSASRRPVAVLRDPQGNDFGVVQGAGSRQVDLA